MRTHGEDERQPKVEVRWDSDGQRTMEETRDLYNAGSAEASRWLRTNPRQPAANPGVTHSRPATRRLPRHPWRRPQPPYPDPELEAGP